VDRGWFLKNRYEPSRDDEWLTALVFSNCLGGGWERWRAPSETPTHAAAVAGSLGGTGTSRRPTSQSIAQPGLVGHDD
jgi:hypothetical protein